MKYKDKDKDYKPRAIGNPTLNNSDLLDFLKTETKSFFSRLFCWHDWIYWKFGPASKTHRVCSKCYKKQQNLDALKASNIWIKETKF